MTNSSDYEQKLHEIRLELTDRINAIHRDTHHIDEPVEKDFAEQATQSENDDVLNALDHEAQQTVRAIDNALQKIANGTFGQCESCGKPINEKRLQAIPYAIQCIECADK